MNIFEEISALEFFMVNNDPGCRAVDKYQRQIKHLESFKDEKLFYKNYPENDINIPDFDYSKDVVAELLHVDINDLEDIDIEVINSEISGIKAAISNSMDSLGYASLKKIDSYKNKALLGGTIQDDKEKKQHLYETKKELNSFLLSDPTMRTFLGGAIDSLIQNPNINFTIDEESFDNSITNLVQNNEISKQEASLYELLYDLCILDSSLITESLKQQQSLEIERINELENEDEITPVEARNRRMEIFKKYNTLKSERINGFNNNQSKNNQVDSMIDAMVNGTMDVNGQPINNMNNNTNTNTRTMGFTAPMLIGLITGICTMGLVIVGIMLTV